MSQNEENPAPPAAMLRVDILGKLYDFHFIDSPNARYSLEKIFSGEEYPHATLPGFAPKAVIDIGANVGAAAVMFAVSFPDATVYCFEPSPANFQLLQRNVSAFKNVRAFPWGLLDRDETVKLYTGADLSLQNSMARSAETTDTFETAQVRRASEEFDRLGITEPSLIKLDTEGCELAILKDLANRLDAVDRLYVEYHSEDDRRAIDALLSDRFVLATARVPKPHRGSMFYLSRRVLAALPELAAPALRVR